MSLSHKIIEVESRLRLRLAVLRGRARRYRTALAYARGRLAPTQAQSMTYDIEIASGWHHLVSLDEDSVMEEALERWKPHPELRELITEACQYVAGKWEDHNDTTYYAKGWALEKVAEYAKEEKIILEPTEDCTDLVPTVFTAEAQP